MTAGFTPGRTGSCRRGRGGGQVMCHTGEIRRIPKNWLSGARRGGNAGGLGSCKTRYERKGGAERSGRAGHPRRGKKQKQVVELREHNLLESTGRAKGWWFHPREIGGGKKIADGAEFMGEKRQWPRRSGARGGGEPAQAGRRHCGSKREGPGPR